MENMQVSSPGKKIKKIRKEFNIKQQDLTGGEITRNLISMLENDKINLTFTTAKIIAQQLNKICKKRNSDFKITPEYLLESVDDQANKIALDFLNYLNNIDYNIPSDFKDKINQIQKFFMKHDIYENKFNIYKKIGDIFKENKLYYNAYSYYLKAFEHSSRLINNKVKIDLLISLSFCCGRINKYKKVLDFDKLALTYIDEMPENIHYAIRLNNSLAYKNLKYYDKALKELDFMSKTFKTPILREFEVLTLKGNCLKEKKHYTEAIKTHKTLLSIIDEHNIEKIFIIYCNIIEVYIELKDITNLKIYLNKCISLLKQYNEIEYKAYCAEIYNDMGLGYKELDELDMSKHFFYKAIKVGKEQRKLSPIISALNNLFKLLCEIEDDIEINNLKNAVLELISIDILSKNDDIILKLIKYYNEKGQKKK
ncbi:helix-turn-helix domain-containing protein (plasmid) [Haloimpatiens sp. FM7330]|uniref:helix-turn-helix domain-containing protein n=1 Tax=Haloimpatiens sp. FM7330 TaxID=3298610 RepID=UPI0036459DD7